jgi:hypothetical protein
MHQFSVPLVLGEDANTQQTVFGFIFEKEGMFIHEPTSSSCGRFHVDPHKQYGISALDAKELAGLNTLLKDATQAALNAGCLEIRQTLGIARGDGAAAFFSDDEKVAVISKALGEYLKFELDSDAKS